MREILPITVAMLPINAAVYVFDGITTGAADFRFMAGERQAGWWELETMWGLGAKWESETKRAFRHKFLAACACFSESNLC